MPSWVRLAHSAFWLSLPLALHAGAAGGGECPDLSGSFFYAGRAWFLASCSVNTMERRDLPLPGEGGYPNSAVNPHRVVFEQRGCELLVIYGKRTVALQTEELQYEDIDRTLTLDLTPAKHRKVTWGESSLTWRQRYTPSGVRWPPWRTEWMELRLKKLPDGSLDYHLRQEGPRGGLMGEVRCVLPPAVD